MHCGIHLRHLISKYNSMRQWNKIYWLGYCLLLLVLLPVGCIKKNSRRMPNMYPAFMYRDKEPMGTNLAYRLLPQQFDGSITLSSRKTNSIVNSFLYMKGTVYITIGKDMALDSAQLDQLLSYVDRGNEFFISSTNIDRRLLDTLSIKNGNDYNAALLPEQRGYAAVQIADSVNYSNHRYGFYYYPFNSFLSGFDSSTTKVLGINDHSQVNYVVTRYGKGKFYFHTAPAAFTNYFLLTANNTNYYTQVFSYLNKEAASVFWGDTNSFGKTDNDFSSLAIFWKNPPLKYALLLACALMLFYIAFGSKRKRRLVPALPVNKNESLSFVHTIGNLYLQKKDNRNIAVKMMTYFMEHVRSSYFLATHTLNAEFIQSLSRKSGVAENKVQALMEKADYLNNTDAITDQELFEINNLIYEFYKR